MAEGEDHLMHFALKTHTQRRLASMQITVDAVLYFVFVLSVATLLKAWCHERK